jgi:hypothetical protein
MKMNNTKQPATPEQVEANYRRILLNDFRNGFAMWLAERGVDTVVQAGITYAEIAPDVWVDFTVPELSAGPGEVNICLPT